MEKGAVSRRGCRTKFSGGQLGSRPSPRPSAAVEGRGEEGVHFLKPLSMNLPTRARPSGRFNKRQAERAEAG